MITSGHRWTNLLKEWFERALVWVKKHREGLTDSALLLAQIAGTVKMMKVAR